ncbi:ABC transporter permease [Pontibacter sp. H259]|uniref:ABC transporter permease n=1 Tax=Pontibacter sp. H259 TaxID=3133421 RepID=UPI0030BE9ACC
MGLILFILLLPVMPLAYTPNQMDLQHTFLEPFVSTAHLFGTDQLGRDVLVNILYGARNGLAIAFIVMLLSTIVGTTIGAVAGYFGNTYKISRSLLLVIIATVAIIAYYGLYLPMQVKLQDLPVRVGYTSAIVGVAISFILWFAVRPLLRRASFLNKHVSFPADALTLRTIELVTSLPKLLILISVAAFAPPSVFILCVIFIFTYWTTPARLARAEMLRIKQLPYMEAALSLGLKHRQIILTQGLPNIISPVVVNFIFGVGSLLAIESTLSFLGIGLPPTFPSWGRTISGIRSDLSAWWLVVFPGGFLAITLLALHICSFYLLQLTQEKRKV